MACIDGLGNVIGHADRLRPLHDCCVGLMMPAEGKSVEPMAAITAPRRTSAQHQSLLQFVGKEQWSDEKVLAKVRGMVLPGIDVPEEIVFETKPQIALDQIHWACEADPPRGVVLTDAAYGVDATLRMAVSDLDLTCVAGVLPGTLAWKPGKKPEPGQGVPKKGCRCEEDIASLEEIVLALPAKAWRTVTWREGTCDVLSSRFARVRVHVAHRHLTADRHAEEWLIMEWPEGEDEPTRYWLSTLPESIAFDRLVDSTKPRWRIERDCQELKQEVGLGHYEWRPSAAWLRQDAGAASIITSRSASPPTAS